MQQETSQEMFDDLKRVTPHVSVRTEHYRHKPTGFGDWLAKSIVHLSAKCADILFQRRYGHRAIVLETIAGVPGMVGGMLQHLKSLRLIKDDRGWIKALLDEAENERIHLLVYSQITKPNLFERGLIMIVQVLFFIVYFLLYFISPWTAHRVVGYFEEEAVHSYETYLRLIHEGVHENISATELAKTYWKLNNDARLSDIVEATIKDEMLHRDVNHAFAEDKHAGLWFA
ncbi:MAG: ubiquinol oxidase [Patescibacteria group bacterium]|nr:ubiquinol oxidase [Patescibacteria group bacterium]